MSCQASLKQEAQRNPLQMTELPSSPWVNVCTDHCEAVKTK